MVSEISKRFSLLSGRKGSGVCGCELITAAARSNPPLGFVRHGAGTSDWGCCHYCCLVPAAPAQHLQVLCLWALHPWVLPFWILHLQVLHLRILASEAELGAGAARCDFCASISCQLPPAALYLSVIKCLGVIPCHHQARAGFAA